MYCDLQAAKNQGTDFFYFNNNWNAWVDWRLLMTLI